MTRPRRLSPEDVARRLAERPGWSGDAVSIHKEYRFADFSAAFGFMTRAALAAERLDHHPDWTNVYSRIAVTLATHDAGGVTELDFRLAETLDLLAGEVPSPPSRNETGGAGTPPEKGGAA